MLRSPVISVNAVNAFNAFCLSACLGLAACRPPAGGPSPESSMNPKALSIEVAVIGDGTAAAAVRCTARNVSGREVHVLDSRRLPYLLDEQGTLVVLHGVHPPPPDRNFNMIEIPTTRPLAAGEALSFEVALAPLRLRGHYVEEPTAPRHGAATVICRIAHGATPIDAAARMRTSIDALLAWQTLEASPPVTVQLP